MGLMSGKKGVVFGVANDHSLAWYIADGCIRRKAELAFTHLPGEKMERRVRKLAEPIGASKIIAPCDVTKDEDVRQFIGKVRETFGQIDFIVHAMAYANRDASPTASGNRRDHFKAGDGHQLRTR